MGTALARDRRGRALPVWQGCRAISQGEIFLMNWDEHASLDDRYFGPIPFSAIIGRAKPLMTMRIPRKLLAVCLFFGHQDPSDPSAIM
jgi:type IV secretory pathway protease TraF